MKVSVNWLRQFTDITLRVDELVTKIGAQLGAVEEVIDLGQKYEGIVIAKVVSCVKHPDADRLHVCAIDDGGITPDVKRDENGYVQVVCGAPNVREGLIVAWIPPGATVPASYDKDPFVLDARELRGVVSNGMLASPQELAIGDSHEGLLEIDLPVAPGTSFAEAYELNDYIIDIENKMFTHRPDCFGILGVAREVAGIQNVAFKSPDWYLQSLDRIKPSKTKLPLEVRNELPELVPRFMAVAMSDVTIKPSPIIMQSYLTRVGLKPINNVVDVTNYLMMLTGQPLHAYDYDKVKERSCDEAAELIARTSQTGEEVDLLNGKTVRTEPPVIVIATSVQAIGIGGVMGGADTEVDENTKNIILECANFDMYSIRRTSMAYGLFTDAVTRFNKGQSPLQNDVVLEEAVSMMQYVSGAQVASNVIDQKSPELGAKSPEVLVTTEFINTRLGLQLDAAQIQRLLENVEFKVEARGDELGVWSPFWRTDIEIAEDVVEEVGRLHGFDKLPLDLPKRNLTPAPKDAMLQLKSSIRQNLAKAGANEVLTYSFVHGNLLDRVGQDREQAFKISNALSPDLQYYRLSLTPSLLEKIHANIKAGYDEFALFEMGIAHGKSEVDEDGLPKEMGRLGLVIAAEAKTAAKQYNGAAYYVARRYVTMLFAGESLRFVPLAEVELGGHILATQMIAPFNPSRAAMVYIGEHPAGVVGEYKHEVQKALKLPDFCAGFELFMSALQAAAPKVHYATLSKFPKVEQDICLKVAADLSYSELLDFVQAEIDSKKPEQTHAALSPVDIYQRKDDTEHKQITFRLSIASYDKTMTDTEVNKLLDEVASAAHDKFGAERI